MFVNNESPSVESGAATDPSAPTSPSTSSSNITRNVLAICALAILALYGINNYDDYTGIFLSNSGVVVDDREFNPDFIAFQDMNMMTIEDEVGVYEEFEVSEFADDDEEIHSATEDNDQSDPGTTISPPHEHSYPTYLVILKSPRSGSRFLDNVLVPNPDIHNLFEPTIPAAKQHFKQCEQMGKTSKSENDNTPWACSVSFNDYLREGRYTQINQLIRDYDATIVIQLRTNVVEKAISKNKRWGELSRDKSGRNIITPSIAKTIQKDSLKGLETIRAFVNAEKFMPKSNNGNGNDDDGKPIWLWYEDLVRNCTSSIQRLHSSIGINVHEESNELCETVKFHEGQYNEALTSELQKEPKLIPMIDALEYNTNVDTDEIYEQLRIETQDIKEVQLGFWRR